MSPSFGRARFPHRLRLRGGFGIALLLMGMSVSCSGLVELYLQNSADQLAECMKKGQYGKMERLLSSGVNANTVSQVRAGTALHFAVQSNDLRAINLLIRNGADVNARSKFGLTPLDWAQRSRTTAPETIALLRQMGGKTEKELDEERGR